MFLSEKTLTWPFESHGRRFASNSDGVTRPREIWRHAQKRLFGTPNELDRTDCMTSLKRAISHRLKTLEAEYAISTLPNNRLRKQTLEKMQDYGIVRPMLLAELMKVRNDIEHKDSPPPELRDCQIYVDVVWYFLKSTDQILDTVADEIIYQDFETNSALILNFHTSGAWKVKVEGVVQPALLSEFRCESDLEILEFKVSPRSSDKLIRFDGTINLTSEIHLRLAHDYFGIHGYAQQDSSA